MKIVVGEGSCGIAAGAEKVRQALLKEDLNGAMLTMKLKILFRLTVILLLKKFSMK